jgi:hypothetical protein
VAHKKFHALPVQPRDQAHPGFTALGVANRRQIVCLQRGWNGEGGKKQERSKPQQSFLHGVISFSGELRRDNVLLQAALFTELG